ncbi:exported hypothetical protein [Hyphomicrobiales bacterium]|nr:exported hypothetical protein [Hyphomicrobiales bacterium]CAH1675116.1 exported hypothetical protein [Hyphomicrobiales bacterium]
MLRALLLTLIAIWQTFAKPVNGSFAHSTSAGMDETTEP